MTIGMFRRLESWIVLVGLGLLAVDWGGPNEIGSVSAAERTSGEKRFGVDPDPYWRDVDRACGPMCLTFVCGYLGHPREYAGVAEVCRPGQSGCSLAQIRDAGRELGLSPLAFSGSVSQLKQLKYPAIVHLAGNSVAPSTPMEAIDHFVVVLRWNTESESFTVFDPPSRFTNVPESRLARFTGVGVVFTNDPQLRLSDVHVAEPQWGGTGLFSSAGILLIGMMVYGRRRRGRRTLGIGAIVLTCACLLTSCAEPPSIDDDVVVGRPRTESSGYQANLGDVTTGTTIQELFEIRNPSGEPVEIGELKGLGGTCGCQSKIVDDERVIPAGGSVDVEVRIPTQGYEGMLLKRWSLETNSPIKELQEIEIRVEARVVAYAKAFPSKIHFGEIDVNEDRPVRRLKIESLVYGDIGRRIRNVHSDSPFVNVRYLSERRGEVIYEVKLTDGLPVGNVRGRLTFEFDTAEIAPLAVEVVGRCAGDISVVPSRLILTSTSQIWPHEYRVRLRSRAGRPFRIQAVEPIDGMQMSWERDAEPRAEWTVLVRVERPVVGKVVGVATFQTDRRDQPSVSVSIIRPQALEVVQIP